ncbi:MAG: hypothetical protein KGJ23_14585 [Euryarchaeota archaeon]|nr:hypothetical protein [Euryarchaeota archaeon]MDE1837827.1 hypothetical protein [Euryarchaeota archaeon]MDE1880101.1 hypothetical protein [Euryarchaeota archaeon]MDE2045061.1 hypothetical protein [Thermoplasmata archaeon]
MSSPSPPERESSWGPLRSFVWVVGLLALLFFAIGMTLTIEGHSGPTAGAPTCHVNCTGNGTPPSAANGPSSFSASPLLLPFLGSGVFFLLWVVGAATLLSRRGPLRPPPSPPRPVEELPPPEEEDDPLSHMV